MLSLRAHALITGGVFAAMIVLAAIGNALHDQGLLTDSFQVQIGARVVFFALTLALFFSAIPLMVKLVLGAQVRLGNAARPAVRRLVARERWIVFAMWGFSALGLAIALPAAIRDGLFEPSTEDLAAALAAAPSRGTLVARPGMLVAEIVRRSSLQPNIGQNVMADETAFAFEIADTAISFPHCRYYLIGYEKDDPTRIDTMSVGTSSRAGSLAEIEAADAALRQQLVADGWLAGHEVDEQARGVHGGQTERPIGRMWLKGDTVLVIEHRRLDDPKPGEAPGAGEWIQFVELGERAHWPRIERVLFAPVPP